VAMDLSLFEGRPQPTLNLVRIGAIIRLKISLLHKIFLIIF
jgi:hypothetical protein